MIYKLYLNRAVLPSPQKAKVTQACDLVLANADVLLPTTSRHMTQAGPIRSTHGALACAFG